MLERVGEAQRIATMQMRDTDKRRKGKRKGAGGNDDNDGDDGQMCALLIALISCSRMLTQCPSVFMRRLQQSHAMLRRFKRKYGKR